MEPPEEIRTWPPPAPPYIDLLLPMPPPLLDLVDLDMDVDIIVAVFRNRTCSDSSSTINLSASTWTLGSACSTNRLNNRMALYDLMWAELIKILVNSNACSAVRIRTFFRSNCVEESRADRSERRRINLN